MSSIIPGYEYDIFISYRQKDNKYDGWVTEFVDNLRKELEATFKDEVSIYFDINPHDGILETHNVNASLKEKLKCLVFIPVISQTYCDPRSFAWQNEFIAFNKMALNDPFGRDIRLKNGNISSRILPIKIHEIDTEDKVLLENELGGTFRYIEFIFRSHGVNRPLRSNEDHPSDNLNKTYYRDQINKVANSVKEIITSIKEGESKEKKYQVLNTAHGNGIKKGKPSGYRKILYILFPVLLLLLSLLVLPKLINRNSSDRARSKDGKLSIAVMPFQNLTNDTTWNIWQEGIQDNLITSLANQPELRVRQTESINTIVESKGYAKYSSLSPAIAGSISRKLSAKIFVSGSINQIGNTLRINAQLFDTDTEEAFRSFQIDGTAQNILHLVDSLSSTIRNALVISRMEKDETPDFLPFNTTTSPEAYKYYILGKRDFIKRDFPGAVKMFTSAVELDTNFIFAMRFLMYSYSNQGLNEDAKKWCLRAYRKKNQMSLLQQMWVNFEHAYYFETTFDAINYLKQLEEIDDQSPFIYFLLGARYEDLLQYENAIPAFERALEIYEKWGTKPWWIYNYTSLGGLYHKTGRFKKEKELYKKAERDYPNDPDLLYRQAILSFSEKDFPSAESYVKRYVEARRNNLATEFAITQDLAGLYAIAGIPEKAESYYRKAMTEDPGNLWLMNNFSGFLIENQKLKEGMQVIDKALTLNPNDYLFYFTKGVGLYKEGKHEEALENLEKSWALKPMYNYSLYKLIEEVKGKINKKRPNQYLIIL